MDPSCLAGLEAEAAGAVAAAATGPAPHPAVWAGETADHSGGGVAGLTDTFRSCFYYATQLGVLPTLGVELAARQCLSGGDYELLQRYGGFAPNPDFFVAWLFKALIGGGASAFNVTQSVAPAVAGVRVFAFSAPPSSGASFSLLVVNLRAAGPPTTVTLAGPGIAGRPRTEWVLAGNLTAENGAVTVSGHAVPLDPVTHLPPPVATLGVPATGDMVVPPATVVFATVA
jgi:hypothetical protein